MCTPLTPEGEVDAGSLARLVDHLLAGGVDALFVLGSSSEVAYLTDAQRKVVLDTVVGHVGGQVPVLAGVIDMTAPRVLDARAGRGRGRGVAAWWRPRRSTRAPIRPRSHRISGPSPPGRGAAVRL